jgi:hypothetical protein
MTEIDTTETQESPLFLSRKTTEIVYRANHPGAWTPSDIDGMAHQMAKDGVPSDAEVSFDGKNSELHVSWTVNEFE